MEHERPLHRVPLPPALLARARERGLCTAHDVLSRSALDLMELLDASYGDATMLLDRVAQRCAPSALTALALQRLLRDCAGAAPTGLPSLDAALGGGLPPGSLTEVTGPAGCGKTQLCLAAAAAVAATSRASALAEAAQPSAVLFYDADRTVVPSRLAELGAAQAGRGAAAAALAVSAPAASILDAVLVSRPTSVADLAARLALAADTVIDHGVRLLVVDSVSALARADPGLATDPARRAVAVASVAARLKRLAETFYMPVLVVGEEGAGAQLGTAWAHSVNTHIALAPHDSLSGVMTATLVKSPAAGPVCVSYTLQARGLVEVASPGESQPQGSA